MALVVGVFTGHGHPGDGIAVDDQGTIYFVARNPLHDSDHHACIYQLKMGSNEPEPFYTSPHPSSNVYIVLGLDGNLYGAERNYHGERNGKDQYTTRVWRFDKNGDREQVLEPRTGRSPYGGPAYLVDENGTFFYADNSIIRKRTTVGKESIFFQTDDSTGDKESSELNSRIFDLAWGPVGEIYMLRLDRVEILGRDGEVRILSSGLENVPFDIVVDQIGNVYLPDWRARVVLKVTDKGERTSVLTSPEPWSAEGVALKGSDLVILEFTGPPEMKIVPRLRVIQRDGKIVERFRFPK